MGFFRDRRVVKTETGGGRGTVVVVCRFGWRVGEWRAIVILAEPLTCMFFFVVFCCFLSCLFAFVLSSHDVIVSTKCVRVCSLLVF